MTTLDNAASNEKPPPPGGVAVARKKLVADGLRKREFVLYFSYSRSLTSTLLQQGEARGRGQKIGVEALLPTTRNASHCGGEFFLFESAVTH
jgi:hypothetical protein